MRFQSGAESRALRSKPHRFPLVAGILTLLQFGAFLLSLSPLVKAHLIVAPEAILRRGQVWRLIVGPFIPSEFSIGPVLFSTACVFIFSWHLERTIGRKRLVALFVGGSIFAGAMWSIAALVWDWKRPLFSPVGMTSLAVGSLIGGLRRPFPAFLPYRIPVWIAFVLYLVGWQVLTFATAIDLSAHFLAGLFAILFSQAATPRTPPRTSPHVETVTTMRLGENEGSKADRPAKPISTDSEFDRRVDDLLRKITDAGYDSLSEEEIALLLEASQRYRDRPPPNP